jgi:(S)-3,5-dihydroxyphenylglycine transaminase
MSYFYLQGGGHHSIRLSVSSLTPAEIREGIARLANFIEDEAERHEPITDARFAREEQA